MRRTNVAVIAGLMALIIGAGLAVSLIRHHKSSSSVATAASVNGSVPVVVAAQALTQGAVGDDLIAQGAVRLDDVPAAQRQATALTSLDQLKGRVLIASVTSGTQVLTTDLQAPLRTINVPTGKQAVAVTVPFAEGVAGYARVDDLVNVYADITGLGKPLACAELLVPGVQVLDVNQAIAPQTGTAQPATASSAARPAGSALTYLLAVDPAQAQEIIFMQENEAVYFTLTQKGQAPPAALPCVGYSQLGHK